MRTSNSELNFVSAKTRLQAFLLGLLVILLTGIAQAQAISTSVPSFAPYEKITNDILPAWSPNGKHIAYSSLSRKSARLCVISTNGGASKDLLNDNYSNIRPAWSPDGQRLAFASNRSGQF